VVQKALRIGVISFNLSSLELKEINLKLVYSS